MEQQVTIPSQAFVPVMDKTRFSELTGIDAGVVQGWIERGYIPTIKLGKHRLINMALLVNQCAEGDF